MCSVQLKTSVAAASKAQVATFYVGKFFLGIEVARVQEVLRSQKMTVVPLAPPVVEGLINLRGQIVPALDMRRRLRLEPRDPGVDPMNVIVRTEDGAVSLIVDAVGDVLDLNSENLELPPDNLSIEASEIILSVYKLNDSLLLLLDTEAAINVSSAS